MKRLICICVALIFSMLLMCQVAWAASPDDSHIYVYVEEKSQKATCTQDGFAYYECINHKDVFYEEIIPASGHDMKVTGETEADCIHAHEIIKTCTRCKYTETTVLGPALGHNYTSVVTEKALCSHEGIKTFTCTRCSETYTQAIAKTPHDYRTITVAATADKTGVVKKVCRVCGDTKIIQILPTVSALQDKNSEMAYSVSVKQKSVSLPMPLNKPFPIENAQENTSDMQMIKRVNEMIITAMLLETGVFAVLIYRDISVLRWYKKQKKAILMKKAV